MRPHVPIFATQIQACDFRALPVARVRHEAIKFVVYCCHLYWLDSASYNLMSPDPFVYHTRPMQLK